MEYKFYDYSISEEIIIDELDILGIEPSADETKIMLVNTDGLAYEIAKTDWEKTNLIAKTIFETCKEDIDQIDEEYERLKAMLDS